jgi:hypothetical protein
LNRELFETFKEAKVLVEDWRLDYNQHRSHSSLKYMTPAAFAASLKATSPAAPAFGAAPLAPEQQAKEKQPILS